MSSSISSVINQLLASDLSHLSKAGVAPFHIPPLAPDAVQASPESENSDLADRRQQQSSQALVDQRAQQRQQSLRDYAKPQLQLGPSEEVALFAKAALEATTALSPVVAQASQVSEETNRARRAVLQNENRDQMSQTLQSRAQESVAYLYARNGNAVYHQEPLFFEAA